MDRVDWGSVPIWLGALSAVVSTTFAGLSFLAQRKSKAERQEAHIQADRAKEAADAAKKLAEQARRSAEAHETQARLAEGAHVAREKSPWLIEPMPGSFNCLLRNGADTPKYRVTATGVSVRGFVVDLDEDDSVIPVIERSDFAELDVMRNGDERVTVGWYQDSDCQGEHLSKSYRLPPSA